MSLACHPTTVVRRGAPRTPDVDQEPHRAVAWTTLVRRSFTAPHETNPYASAIFVASKNKPNPSGKAAISETQIGKFVSTCRTPKQMPTQTSHTIRRIGCFQN